MSKAFGGLASWGARGRRPNQSVLAGVQHGYWSGRRVARSRCPGECCRAGAQGGRLPRADVAPTGLILVREDGGDVRRAGSEAACASAQSRYWPSREDPCGYRPHSDWMTGALAGSSAQPICLSELPLITEERG